MTKFKKIKGDAKFSVSKQKRKRVADQIEDLIKKYSSIDPAAISTFQDFPVSHLTQQGLKDSNYTIPTEIQKQSIGLGLQGKDILGAAETGSGKTLAFLIPVLEILYVKKWTQLDGLGAMIITPTRELAYQIFETLKKVGVHHDFSAGLIIGGKDLHFEKERMDQCNIVICTPGRILHHMDVNPLFDCSNLQILILDEADRCLDMGFERTMNSIIENLPSTRQTLLFSATQTKSVKDLARLSLKAPAYISVHENKKHTTPDALEQSYIVCQLEDKINFLWSFVKNHRRQKILIFLSSCKQVKYIYSLFCRLRPGSPLLALYGTLHQLRRMNIYKEFCNKQNVVMFATDIAARGLDFPEVNWVIQLDCPEDANTYIHRAGRTARYSKGGESLLALLPSEETAMINELTSKRVPITKIEVNRTKLMTPIKKIEALVARDPELKADAQRCFLAYIKSVYLMKNKDIFNVENINFKNYAASLGLAVTPKVRFLNKFKSDGGGVNGDDTETKEDIDNFEGEIMQSKSDADCSGFLTLKRKDHDLCDELMTDSGVEQQLSKKQKKKAVITKAAAAKKILRKKIVANNKIVFGDGDSVVKKGKEKFSEVARAYENEDAAGLDIAKAKLILKAEDKFDKKLFRERVKQKHKEAKRKQKQTQFEDEFDDDDKDESTRVRLGGSDESDDGYEPDTSWIPDPDKFYGKKEDSFENSTNDEVSLKIRKRTDSEKPMKKKKRKLDNVDHSDNKSGGFATGLTLIEDEEIALKILQSAR